MIISSDNVIGIDTILDGKTGTIYSPSAILPLVAQGNSDASRFSLVVQKSCQNCSYEGSYTLTQIDGSSAWGNLSDKVRGLHTSV